MTSGGDCSGMNAAIRSVVRTALVNNLEIYGFKHGFEGLLEKIYEPLDSKSVSGIIQRGGTILQTARCEEFKTERGQKTAIDNLRELGVEGLIIIGGNGSMAGALTLHQLGFPTIGIPATIDNDIYGTDMSIGADTALNTIAHAIDIIRDTASSHDRAFIIEVMGRESGYLALMSAIACGAEAAIIPEVDYDLEKIAQHLYRRYKAGKTNSLVIVAEGASTAYAIERKLKHSIGYETRITVLGHLQRGGETSVFDRLLASRMGMKAVQALLNGESGKMVALRNNNYIMIDLEEAVGQKKELDKELLKLTHVLES